MGVVGRSLSGVARGQRALLEADDAVGDVRGVRVDRRHADRREVVREVAPRVELAVLGAIAAAFLVGGAPGEVTEEAGPAGGYAPEALYRGARSVYAVRSPPSPSQLAALEHEKSFPQASSSWGGLASLYLRIYSRV